jgi:hypothetical protein
VIAVVMVLRAKVARSAGSERKLCTGRPSSVRPVVCFLTAAGERSACATTLLRRGGRPAVVGFLEDQRQRLGVDLGDLSRVRSRPISSPDQFHQQCHEPETTFAANGIVRKPL